MPKISEKPKYISSKKTGPPPPSKIKGGELAKENEFPYLVDIRFSESQTIHFGAGSLISTDEFRPTDSPWILTSRHNVVDFRDPIGVWVNLAVYPKYTNSWKNLTEAGKPYKIAKSFCYPWPADQGKKNLDDIALIKLDSVIIISVGDQKPKIESIRLTNTSYVGNDVDEIRLAGWGRTAEIEVFSDNLTSLRLSIAGAGMCEKIDIFDAKRRFCAVTTGPAPCYGDRGSPVVVRGETDLQIGVATRMIKQDGSECPTNFGVMRVPYYRNWIKEVMDNEPSKYLCENLLNRQNKAFKKKHYQV
ncbi:serine protease 3-like [Brevipalpus obovatus]|uniref:serine protease 3-like n=1 Tax=Brevipalpus obovatus TaxID=246614 RepID=UPI003D9F2F15